MKTTIKIIEKKTTTMTIIMKLLMVKISPLILMINLITRVIINIFITKPSRPSIGKYLGISHIHTREFSVTPR